MRTFAEREFVRSVSPEKIRRAVFTFHLEGGGRARTVAITGTNRIAFGLLSRRGEIFQYLKIWGILS